MVGLELDWVLGTQVGLVPPSGLVFHSRAVALRTAWGAPRAACSKTEVLQMQKAGSPLFRILVSVRTGCLSCASGWHAPAGVACSGSISWG